MEETEVVVGVYRGVNDWSTGQGRKEAPARAAAAASWAVNVFCWEAGEGEGEEEFVVGIVGLILANVG